MGPRIIQVEQLPGDGSPVWYYPGSTTKGGRDGILLRILAGDGGGRLCMVAWDYSKPIGPLELPDGRHLCANGLILSLEDPGYCEPVGVWPVKVAQPTPSGGWLIFHDEIRAVAYGPNGRAWQSGRLAMDELSIVAVTDELIRFRGLGLADIAKDRKGLIGSHITVLDVATGNIIEGHEFDWERDSCREPRPRFNAAAIVLAD